MNVSRELGMLTMHQTQVQPSGQSDSGMLLCHRNCKILGTAAGSRNGEVMKGVHEGNWAEAYSVSKRNCTVLIAPRRLVSRRVSRYPQGVVALVANLQCTRRMPGH